MATESATASSVTIEDAPAEKECCICQETSTKEFYDTGTFCKHEVHSACITEWWRKCPSEKVMRCPLCDVSFREEEDDDKQSDRPLRIAIIDASDWFSTSAPTAAPDPERERLDKRVRDARAQVERALDSALQMMQELAPRFNGHIPKSLIVPHLQRLVDYITALDSARQNMHARGYEVPPEAYTTLDNHPRLRQFMDFLASSDASR